MTGFDNGPAPPGRVWQLRCTVCYRQETDGGRVYQSCGEPHCAGRIVPAAVEERK